MKKLIRKDNPNVVIDALWVKESIVGNNKFYDISLRDMKILPGEAHVSVSQDEWIVVDVDEEPVDFEKLALEKWPVVMVPKDPWDVDEDGSEEDLNEFDRDAYLQGLKEGYELGLKARKGEQEQQEVNLEEFTEKMNAWKARFNRPDDIPIKATMAFTARMFYMYSNVARQWYEQLPKATMDFNTRKEKEE